MSNLPNVIFRSDSMLPYNSTIVDPKTQLLAYSGSNVLRLLEVRNLHKMDAYNNCGSHQLGIINMFICHYWKISSSLANSYYPKVIK